MDHVIQVRNLVKSYGKVMALRGISITVNRGEIYVFLGRNGAGKTTTIRILMGITEPTSGEVLVFGAPIYANPIAIRERVGYVAQEQHFYGWMKGEELARFVSAFYPTWDHNEWQRLVKRLEIPTNQRVDTLSAGTKAKLALALALAHNPPLLILDEPTAGLDPVARREFLEILRESSSNRTTFFSTHLVDEVESIAHRVGIIDQGQSRFEGTVDTLVKRYRYLSIPSFSPLQEPSQEMINLLERHAIHLLHTQHHPGLLRLLLQSPSPNAFDALLADPAFTSTFQGEATIQNLSLEESFVALVRYSSASSSPE
ncbi:MAG: ABC transporter ATP-binding protein [Deltaproteobacteria bacterium]|nr:ABC transporter ATP-binding protein [Deltaproteobacteria bacterium]